MECLNDVAFNQINLYLFQFRSGPPAPAAKAVTPKPVPQPKASEESSNAIASTQPFLALPTTPIIIIPYALIRGANVLPGPL